MKFIIKANHQRSQPTRSYYAMCPHVKCYLLILIFILLFMPLLNVGACVCHITREGHGVDHDSVGDVRTNSNCPHISFVLFHNVVCYTNSIASHIHVNTTKIRNIKCTLVATSVILQSLECTKSGVMLSKTSF